MSRTGYCLSHSFKPVIKKKNFFFYQINFFFSIRFIQPTGDLSIDIDISLLVLRVGTKFGVVTHTFRIETKLDLDYWINSISQSLRSTIIRTKEVIFRM
jgi:hypothetical protein